jgi:hypothetical protein
MVKERHGITANAPTNVAGSTEVIHKSIGIGDTFQIQYRYQYRRYFFLAHIGIGIGDTFQKYR